MGSLPVISPRGLDPEFYPGNRGQDALYNDLGISMFRVNIPAVAGDGDGNLYDNKMQELYDLIQIGETRGKHDYIISVWSPPVGMKTIPTANGWTGTEHVRLRPEKEQAFTDYLVKVIQWLKNKGVSVPKAISFQNEPLSMIVSEWCYWGGDNGAQFQRVTKLLRSKLDAAGLTGVQILAPEGATYHENELLLGHEFSALTNDPALNSAIGGMASHSYFAKGYDTTSVYQDYADALDHVPGKERWQTEYSTLISGVSEMDMAINASQRLASDMAFIRNNYWFWWLGWAANRHPTDVGEVLLDGNGVTVTKSKAFYVLAKIFNNAPVGSKVRRITADAASGLTTDNSVWMDGVAFVNGSKTTALLVNPTAQEKIVHVNGLSGLTASVHQITPDIPLGQDMKLTGKRNIIGGTASAVALPAKSVTVIVTSDADAAPPFVSFDQTVSSSVYDADYAVRNAQFTVSGHLDEVGTLKINGQPVAVANDLSFSTTLQLQAGLNVISAVATDLSGNQGDPMLLDIRFDPTYLGLTLNHSSLNHVNQSMFTVSGKTNSRATVKVKHEFNGDTVAESSYSVAGAGSSGHQLGELIQPLIKDGWPQPGAAGTPYTGGLGSTYMGVLGASSGGLTTNAVGVWDSASTFASAEGTSSLRMKLGQYPDGGFARLNLDFLNSSWQGITKDLSLYHHTGALQFRVNASSTDSSFSAVVESNNGTRVESRLPLANYINAAVYSNQWALVTIPLADFDNAVHYVPSTDVTAYNRTINEQIDWTKISGFAFLSQATMFISPRVDDIKIVYLDVSPTAGGSTTFSAGLNLKQGDNLITVSAENEAGQQAEPKVIHVVYDPVAPVITVPAAGSTTTTSYVLKGTVSETATVTVNGVAVNLQNDESFTAIVPVVKGSNTITIVATDPAGNASTATVNVDCNPSQDGSIVWGVAAGNRSAHSPIIDGDLSEADWIINNGVRRIITGTPDNSAFFGTLWDDQNLYVAVRVLDGHLVNDSEASKTYQDDSVEIYLDGNNDRSTAYGPDDHQITLGWHDTQLSVGSNMAGLQYAQQDIDGGYSVEMAIPWSSIGIPAPKVGSVIGFDIGINDDDGRSNGNRESQLMWTGDNENWKSTANFGALYLNDGRKVTAAVQHTGPIMVDGTLNESDWLLRNHATKTITGTPNNAVSFATLSNAQNLYVGLMILDSVLKNDSTQAHQDDSIEIYLDPNNSQGTSYEANDRQITLGWHDGQLSIGGNITDIQYAQKDIDGGYTVEISIPWASLGITPARDITIGFDVGNNDDDGNNNGNRESQLMWNGTGNNWQDTSNFGHLLLHNLNLPLPVVGTPEPEGLVEFSDDAHDFAKLYSKSAKIAVQTSNPQNFDYDAASFIHTNDNPDPAEYVMYKSPYGDIYSLDISTGLFSNTPQFSFYGSADGVNFTPIQVKSKQTGGANGYSVWSNTASNLPAGTKYLKAVFSGKLNWHERLLSVSFKYLAEPVQPEDPIKLQWTDEADGLTKLYDKSANIVQATATSGLDKYGNDATQFRHENDDSMNPEYVIYKSSANDIYSFDINVSAWTGLPSSVGFEIATSTDGVSFTKLTPDQTLLSSSSGFNTIRIKVDSLTRGYRYLKIVFPYGNEACDNWTATINKVTFVYGSNTVPVTGVSIAPDTVELHVGETTQLTATVAPEQATNKAVSWSTSDGTVAEVSDSGVVTAKKAGIAAVTATTADGSLTATAQVTVEALPAGGTSYYFTGPSHVETEELFQLNYGLSNVTNSVYAQSVTVNYNPADLEYVDSSSLINGFTVVGSTYGSGSVKILAASTGSNSPVTGSLDLFTLTFKAKNQTVTTNVYTSGIILGDQSGNEQTVNSGSGHSISIAPPVPIDKTELSAAIAEASAAVASAKVLNPAAPRFGYYPQSAIDALVVALVAANAVYDQSKVTQSQVDQASIALSQALAEFRASASQSAGVGDLALISANYQATSSAPNWASIRYLDLNNDGKLDLADLIAMAQRILN
ncbi:sugar-binding protein [Paenibacillus sp. NPDC056579]|uniref:sugar-binding protein n=1 Tax=Paenibacillus sp. NPDC056579 TaxID=3345871 RepID=UPI00369C94DA